MAAPYQTLSVNTGGVLNYLGRQIPPPTQDQKDCLKAVFAHMQNGTIHLIPGKSGFFLPVYACDHLIISYEIKPDQLHISRVQPFTPGAP